MKLFRQNKYLWEFVLLSISIAIFIASFLLSSSYLNTISLDQQSEFFEKQINNRVVEFDSLLHSKGLLMRLTQSQESLKDLTNIAEEPFYFYIYNRDNNKEFLRFWNTSIVIPSDDIIYGPKDEQVVLLPNGYYYSLRKPVPGNPGFTAYCLILIKSSFFVQTDYLRNDYPFNRSMNNVMDITFTPTKYQVRANNGAPLFYLKYKPNIQAAKDSILSVTLKIIGLFLIFLSLYAIFIKYLGRRNYLRHIYLLVASLAAFRITLYLVATSWGLADFYLFDPTIYGTNTLLPTLGDLLINSILFCWVAVFIWYRITNRRYNILKYSKKKVWSVGGICLTLLVAVTFLLSGVIRSIIADSKISFDVTNISSLGIFTAVGFFILACLSLGYYYLSRILYKYILPAFKKNRYLLYLAIIVISLLGITLFIKGSSVSFFLPVMFWLMVYTFVFTREQSIYAAVKYSVSGTILWIFVFSVSISLLVLNEINKAEIALRKLYIEKLAAQTDPASERLISIANKYLDSNYFANNFYRLYDREQNELMRDSIRKRNYIGYLNNYVTNLYFFDSLGNSLYNPAPQTVASLNTIITRQSRLTSLPDMYFYETDYDKFAYITKRVIRKNNSSHILGTVFIVSNPKKFAGASIKPELFKQFNQWELSNSPIYQYAIYHDRQLTSSTKKYPFTSYLSPDLMPKSRFEIKNREGYSEIWYRANATKVIVMVRKSEVLLEAITLFSYIFCSFLFLVALINLVMMLIRIFINGEKLSQSIIFPTIRSQIHSTFILINVLAFIIVGVATISFFINRFEESNNDRLGKTMNIMLNEITSYDSLGSLISDKKIVANLFNANSLDSVIKRVSDIHGLDVNVYDLTGQLRASSQPDVYNGGILSIQMSPTAFYNLLRLRQIEYIQKEKVSNLSFNTIYAPVVNDQSKPYAYLSIPYFTSQQELNQEISSFLITLINLYAFIFLLTGLLALFITNRITGSFTVIGNKMKRVNFSENNEEIIWDRKDEIGQLIAEYNKMVSKLKETADSIAKSERQEAWREMARQVAHEIKNPLTPMKLSLQYLQKAIKENSPNTQQLTSSVAKTLVEQMDHLSKIAADFSQFANINHVHADVFDLHEVLLPLESMYSKNPRVEFNWEAIPTPIPVRADRTQMNRLFTNLLVNAIDATEDNAKCILHVKEIIADGGIIISINDNGTGISDEMKAKIFTPNFTTKSSGTGLGLAMCKGIVEKANGSIWFETVAKVGTTFFIKLPLIV